MKCKPIVALLLLLGAVACSEDPSSPLPGDPVRLNAPTPSPALSGIPAMPQSHGCAPLDATVYGYHDGENWVGHALISLDRMEPELATFVARSTGVDIDALLAGDPFTGTEVYTLTFEDGASFDIDGRYIAVPASTPALYTLHETGVVGDGTARFSGVSGHVTVHGPFLSPVLVTEPPGVTWMKGWSCS